MIRFEINNEKLITATLYILNSIGSIDFHKLFKILYFADQKHLASYGRPIIGDRYIAMRKGPVPTRLYDILKFVKGKEVLNEFDSSYKEYFAVKGYHVSPMVKPDLDYLAESDIECIDESINENKDLGFDELVDKSHGVAYKESFQDDRISFVSIAKEGGAADEIIKYIKFNAVN